MRSLDEAKWSYVSRRVDRDVPVRVAEDTRAPRPGDLVVAEVVEVGAHQHLESPHGRRIRLYPGDLLVGAYGSRYATDYYEGYPPAPGDPVHLLTAGGLIGTVASAHTGRAAPTELAALGSLAGADGAPATLDDVALALPAPARPRLGTVVVVGSAMNAGKTTTTAAVVRGLTRAGLRVGAGKVTGSGSGKDHWAYLDAGAAVTADFLDFGMPSTFGYPPERLAATMTAIRDHLAGRGADAVVLEIADGVLQHETRALAARLPGFADRTVLAVGDALGAVAGVGLLAELGVTVAAISGLVTASPLAVREAREATGLPVLSPTDLVQGRATDLLAESDALAGAVRAAP